MYIGLVMLLTRLIKYSIIARILAPLFFADTSILHTLQSGSQPAKRSISPSKVLQLSKQFLIGRKSMLTRKMSLQTRIKPYHLAVHCSRRRPL